MSRIDPVDMAFMEAALEDAGFHDESQASAPAAPHASNGHSHNGNGQPFDVPGFLSRNGIRVKRIDQSGGATKYILEECPFDPSHKAPDSFVGVYPNGARSFHCSHNSCSGYKWQQFREKFEPGYRNKSRPANYERHGHADERSENERAQPSRIEYQSLTLSALRDVPDPVYLIPGILDLSQPGVIAGQFKSLKTTIALLLAYCIVTGADFLGKFTPARTARVGMFSGEAGPAQIRSTLSRIAKSYGDSDPWSHDGLILSCEKMPRLGSLEYMDALERWIGQHELELLIIDPAYAALSAIGDSAGNYYKVADLLFQVTDLQKKTGCVILLCPHMTKAPKSDPPMLSDIQWSGFSEWSGQWLLLGKRKEWDDETGQHWLWLVAGGRSGHSTTYGLDVREGRQGDLGGKVLEIEVLDKNDAFADCRDAKKQQQDAVDAQQRVKAEEQIRDAFLSLGDGWHIKKHVMERSGTSGRGKAIEAAWGAMLRRGEIRVEIDACRGGKNVPCDGYRLNQKN